MKFEFDNRKSRANKTKYGIDFVKAQTLWSDPDFIEIPARPVSGNDYCPCRIGLKFKKCCMLKQSE